ncbi:hypothetical protein [Spiroplasma endosymbiont of Nebria brevicollis]|uniref:hypothetical protein n=1 Tax=Spiroplasma endosymbiont of Nebria brevicollis TaxID=3066284 RepID=UPI00313B0943
MNKYDINFDNNCKNIDKLKQLKIEFVKEYDKKINLKNNCFLDLKKILTLIREEIENIVSNKIYRKVSKDSEISNIFEEGIDTLEYFKEKEINSIDLQNPQSSTSSTKPNSPQM